MDLDRSIPIVFALAALLGTSLVLAGCPDECYQEHGDQDCRFNDGERRCGVGSALNVVEECGQDSGTGCYVWTPVEPCEGSLRCDPVDGECVCRNECSHAEGSTCVDDVIYACAEDEEGCLVETEDDCGVRSLSCQMGADGRHRCCRTDCQPGEGQCNGTLVEWCLLDETGCAEWTAVRDCGVVGCEEAAEGVTCGGVEGCLFECFEGETRCTGDHVERCADEGDGCFGWTLGTDCSAFDETCVSSAAGTWCSGGCSHECDVVGESRCAETAIQTCVAGGDGCRGWSDGEDCADSDGECDDSGGTAECVTPEVCDDTVDNDGDGAVDCDDPDCGGDPACPCHVVDQDCPPTLTCIPTDDTIDGGVCVPPGPGAIGDRCAADCGFGLHCVEVDWSPDPPECRVLCAPSGPCTAGASCSPVFVIGFGISAWGVCDPNEETACADGFDNDGDGATDCSDADCSSDPSCAREARRQSGSM